jgi:hypothetical protein
MNVAAKPAPVFESERTGLGCLAQSHTAVTRAAHRTNLMSDGRDFFPASWPEGPSSRAFPHTLARNRTRQSIRPALSDFGLPLVASTIRLGDPTAGSAKGVFTFAGGRARESGIVSRIVFCTRIIRYILFSNNN